ncbi:MAG: DMT family transporter [Xanthomonadales bacterium]|nr:DMT family transporter [Xanthomonadales bacterium]
MARHTTTGRWQLGLMLALTTMLAWASLPVALKLTLEFVDPWTLTWFRFASAAALLLVWQGPKRSFSGFRRLRQALWALLFIAALGLMGNYVFYLLGLAQIGPAIAQIIIQLAPLLMGLGGIAIFGERYNLAQWLGFITLIFGLGFFFHHQFSALNSHELAPQSLSERSNALWQGAIFLGISAVSWAAYALAQKQLLRDFSSMRIMLFIYLFASITLASSADLQAFHGLNAVQWALLAFCALNTLVAYGAFAEALNHWEASRVSAVLALTPLGTFLVAMLVTYWYPDNLAPENLDWLSWMGAIVVVVGSMVTSLAGKKKPKEAE